MSRVRLIDDFPPRQLSDVGKLVVAAVDALRPGPVKLPTVLAGTQGDIIATCGRLLFVKFDNVEEELVMLAHMVEVV